MTNRKKPNTALLAVFLVGCLVISAFAGDLVPPPGPITPQFKTLSEVEPRTPIQSLSGDGSSLFVIDEPGSYYLIENLFGEPGKNGISIRADNVTIDLAGFSLFGVPGSLNGIHFPENHFGIQIKNGGIRNWDGQGLGTGLLFASVISDIRVIGNGSFGIHVGPSCVVSRCTSHNNGMRGITAGRGSTISSCTANENNGDGIWTSGSVTVSNCGAYKNAGNGFKIGEGGNISGCVAWNNTSDGIFCDQGCRVEGNSTYNNSQWGINATDSLVTGNASTLNSAGNIGTNGSTVIGNHAS